MPYPRSQQAAIDRATETQTQVISAFGAGHPLALQVKELLAAITAAAIAAQEPPSPLPLPPAVEPGPA